MPNCTEPVERASQLITCRRCTGGDRHLKKQQLRDWLHVIASSKAGYELRYYNIHEQDAEEDEE